LIIGIDPNEWCASLVAYNLRKPYTHFHTPDHINAGFFIRYPELWPTKNLKEFYKELVKNFPEKFGSVKIISAYAERIFLLYT